MITETIMVKNFIRKYGRNDLRKIVNYFVEKRSNQAIAQEFGVTRQRVHQWQKAFVEELIKPRKYVKKEMEDVS